MSSVNEENAVMRERERIRAEIVKIPTFNGHIPLSEVLKIISQ